MWSSRRQGATEAGQQGQCHGSFFVLVTLFCMVFVSFFFLLFILEGKMFFLKKISRLPKSNDICPCATTQTKCVCVFFPIYM